MGAFENQISENETFGSLMALYKTQLRDNRDMRAKVFELSDRLKELLARAEKAEAMAKRRLNQIKSAHWLFLGGAYEAAKNILAVICTSAAGEGPATFEANQNNKREKSE